MEERTYIISVSYTHLDVYKRQQMCWRIKEMNLFGFDSANGIRVHLDKYFGVSMASADTCAGDIVCLFRQVLGNESVSYTHLDVYKRQAVEYVRGIPVVKVFQQTIYSFKNFPRCIMNYNKIPQRLKERFHAQDMDEVFRQLARKAVRS